MTQVTMDDFKKHKVFVSVTTLLGFFGIWAAQTQPTYLNDQQAFWWTFVGVPLGGWWFLYFWNIVVVKLFEVKPISWGVALFLTLALTVLLS